jgi:hypothetical protein
LAGIATRIKLYTYANFDVIPGQDGQTSGAATNKPHANTASKWSLDLNFARAAC